MAITTNPLVPGAPLSEADYPRSGGIGKQLPATKQINDELIRAKVELMHAIARHRKAWARMRAQRDEAEAKSIWAESHPPYQEAVADVRWWREEMNAQAATVTALSTMLDQATNEQATSEQATSEQASARGPSVRQLVLDYDGTRAPTQAEINAARLWMGVNGANKQTPGSMSRPHWAACCNLLQSAFRYREAAQPPVCKWYGETHKASCHGAAGELLCQ